MTDRYENIRLALEMGPTPGPWVHDGDGVTADDEDVAVAMCCPSEVEAAFIAACDPDTIRALLAERDALREVLTEMHEAAAILKVAREDAERLAFLAREPVIEGFVGVKKDIYDYAMNCADEGGRDEPNDEDMLNGLRRLIDAAIDQARG